MSSSPSPLIWFLLVDSITGQPYKGTSADKVSIAFTADVADFRDAVQLKYDKPNYLKDIPSGVLLVYKNKAAFDKRNAAADEGREESLEEDSLVYGLGTSKKEALFVVVPSSESISQSASEFNTAINQPHPKRKQRWIELNAILEGSSKKSKMNDSMAYSNVTWNQVKSVFNPKTYVQPQRSIDENHLDFFRKYLSYVTKCLGIITTGKEAKRLHFIAPVLICVCALFDGDVDIVVEEDLVGNFVKAHGHFEFMMRRGNKAVCIVEAKKDDVEQGMAQDLVGCEVVSEVGGLDIVYGIVTNYMQWNFLGSLNDKVEIDEQNMDMSSCGGPEQHSIKKISEKIYAMLSDE
jgi:hypothetical protein